MRVSTRFLLRYSVVPIVVAACAAASQGEPREYEIGGPLAGVKLPPYPTQHGEPPGQPGVLLETDDDGQPIRPAANEPELHLYEGAVEHFRTYWHKYLGVRSFFDRQSMVRNFVTPDIPGADPEQVEQYAEPVYYVPRQDAPINTGDRRDPVPVIRCTVENPVFKLDLGKLERGMYCVRVIGAVPTEKLRPFLLPIFVEMRVNDGLAGEVSGHRIRIGYQDEFYSVAELYFHAPAERQYRAEVTLGAGSKTDLLVHNITLDDVLAGCERRAIKRRTTMHGPAEIAALEKSYAVWGYRREQAKRKSRSETEPASPRRAERWRRDELIWQGLPRASQQYAETKCYPGEQPRGATLGRGVPGLDEQQIEDKHGVWKPALRANLRAGDAALENVDILLINEKLGLKYTMADLAAGRPLPDPFPYKDDGAGMYFPDDRDPTKGHAYWPIARAAEQRLDVYLRLIDAGTAQWPTVGETPLVRDAAVALVRFAYQFPSVDAAHCLRVVTTDSWFRNRTLFRRRVAEQQVYGNFIRFHEPVIYYDRLFDYIHGNRELAESIGRFVPWVKTPEDVIELLDVYLVQTMAKRVLRYHWYGDGRQPTRIAELAIALGDNRVTDPWMEWLFSRTFFYPHSATGVQDLMITNTDRDGRSPIGSRTYALGDFSAGRIAASLDGYLAAGGNPRFDLVQHDRYPKVVTSTWFWLRHWTAGLYFPRIGNVTGADKQYAHNFGEKGKLFDIDRGWQWTGDPQFAYVIWHYLDHSKYDEQQLKRIEQAAGKLRRAPWLDNRSRVLPGWAGFLESGVEHDDFRFRRSAVVRVGMGQGHAHHDSLDLQLHAHGLPMTIDGGQRGGYSEPGDNHTRVHNTVEVDGQNHSAYCWVRTLSDSPGAAYLAAQGVPPAGADLFRRQVALIDVDEGSGSQSLSPEQTGPSPTDLPTDMVTPNSYVFDVFRVRGGSQHTYGFHGPVNEPIQINSTQRVRIARAPAADREYLGLFGAAPEKKFAGTVPEVLECTWPMIRQSAERRNGTEQFMLQRAYDPGAPQKFTRLHLFGNKGARALEADSVCRVRDYQFTCLMIQTKNATKNGTGLFSGRPSPLFSNVSDRKRDLSRFSTVFPAIIEPYAGKPFITGVQLLPVDDNEDNALRAVAVEVKTANGHTDVCFADGRPPTTRRMGNLKISGEFAYLSRDEQGLRQATLVGGTLLEGPDIRLEPTHAERTAKVLEVDYFGRWIRIDDTWPASREEQLLEIGALPENAPTAYTTGYTAETVEPQASGTRIRFVRGADLYRSRIESVDESSGSVTCALGVPTPVLGVTQGFVASNEALTKFWRVESVDGKRFHLVGDPVRQKDFAPHGALRLWEYGVGDRVRQSTSVSLRRMERNVFEVETDVAVRIALPAQTVKITRAGKPLPTDVTSPRPGWLALELEPDDASVRLRMLR
jgi:hypothetical protein